MAKTMEGCFRGDKPATHPPEVGNKLGVAARNDAVGRHPEVRRVLGHVHRLQQRDEGGVLTNTFGSDRAEGRAGGRESVAEG